MKSETPLQRLGAWLDRRVPGPVYRIGAILYNSYNKNKVLNFCRRHRDYWWLYVVSRVRDGPWALHLGCGNDNTDMVDIDYLRTKATDYVLDARHLPFPYCSIEKIETYHMVEHIPPNTLNEMFQEWKRVLKPGGKLVMELPDFDNVVREYLEVGDPEREQVLLRYVFGSQRFETDHHYWGWNYERLRSILIDIGFQDIRKKKATDNHAEEAPCFRIEAEVE